MEIIIIMAIASIVLYVLLKEKKDDGINTGNKLLNIEEMWERASTSMAQVLEESPNLENYLQDERDMVKSMEIDMLRLRERYKHDLVKQLEIARDWMDYSRAVAKIKTAAEIMEVDMEETAHDSYEKRTKEASLIIQEVSKRIEELLGEDSQSKIVHDRINKRIESKMAEFQKFLNNKK